MENKMTFKEKNNEDKNQSSFKNFLPPKKRYIHYQDNNSSEESRQSQVEKKSPLIQAGVIRGFFKKKCKKSEIVLIYLNLPPTERVKNKRTKYGSHPYLLLREKNLNLFNPWLIGR